MIETLPAKRTRAKEFDVKLRVLGRNYTYFNFEQRVSAENGYHALAQVLTGDTFPGGQVVAITIEEVVDGG